jgi:hypothetical protein
LYCGATHGISVPRSDTIRFSGCHVVCVEIECRDAIARLNPCGPTRARRPAASPELPFSVSDHDRVKEVPELPPVPLIVSLASLIVTPTARGTTICAMEAVPLPIGPESGRD